MSDSTGKTRSGTKPGAVLKALRAKNGWTLADVERKTGLTVSTLSKIENDKIDVNFEKLVLLSEGLDIDVAQLFGTAGEGPAPAERATRRSVTRGGEGRSIPVDGGNYIYLATDLLHKRMIPIVGEVFRRDISEYDEYLQHEGEEFVFVIQGVLELHTALYTPVRLEVGDTVYFDSSMKHAYVAVGDEPCRILSVNATSEAHMMEILEQRAVAAEPEAKGAAPRVRRRAAG